ncbi:MAG: SRPBCC family protein [Anaerolineae bacterium]|nr:SRPBCC family protein [Anaerolineae bacterium]
MEASITINRPVEEVFAFVTDVGSWTKWNEELTHVEQVSEGPIGVGTICKGMAEVMGKMAFAAQILEYEPNQKVVQRMNIGPAKFQATWTFEPAPEGTRFTLNSRAQSEGLGRVSSSLFDGMFKKRLGANLARLKAIMEG